MKGQSLRTALFSFVYLEKPAVSPARGRRSLAATVLLAGQRSLLPGIATRTKRQRIRSPFWLAARLVADGWPYAAQLHPCCLCGSLAIQCSRRPPFSALSPSSGRRPREMWLHPKRHGLAKPCAFSLERRVCTSQSGGTVGPRATARSAGE